MGGDGGSIPGRADLVKEKQKEKRCSANDLSVAKWKHCALSQNVLKKPIVACELGYLFNKDEIIKMLLDKERPPNEKFAHIKKLKNVKTLQLTQLAGEAVSGGGGGDDATTRMPAHEDVMLHNAHMATFDFSDWDFCCPITRLAMNGRYAFVCVWSCGCVFSEKALRETRLLNSKEGNDPLTSSSQSAMFCLNCSKPCFASDIVVLNPDANSSAFQKNFERMQERRSKKRATTNGSAERTQQQQEQQQQMQQCSSREERKRAKQQKQQQDDKNNDVTEGKISAATNKRRKVCRAEDPSASLASSSGGQSGGSTVRNRLWIESALNYSGSRGIYGQSVQSDPTKSDVFKSLFSSKDTPKERVQFMPG